MLIEDEHYLCPDAVVAFGHHAADGPRYQARRPLACMGAKSIVMHAPKRFQIDVFKKTIAFASKRSLSVLLIFEQGSHTER